MVHRLGIDFLFCPSDDGKLLKQWKERVGIFQVKGLAACLVKRELGLTEPQSFRLTGSE